MECKTYDLLDFLKNVIVAQFTRIIETQSIIPVPFFNVGYLKSAML